MRGIKMLGAATVAMGVLGVTPGVAGAQPETVTCVGHSTLGPPTNFTSTGGEGVTIQRWDFTGNQDLCLADGTVVLAALTGRISLFTRADGTGWVLVHYTDTIPMGTLDGTVVTHFSPTSFDARVHAFGGTGVLTGMTGTGTTVMTGPNTFDDVMEYRYR